MQSIRITFSQLAVFSLIAKKVLFDDFDLMLLSSLGKKWLKSGTGNIFQRFVKYFDSRIPKDTYLNKFEIKIHY